MLSTVRDNKYIVLEDDSAYAQEFDKEQVDKALKDLRAAFSSLAKIYGNLEESNICEFFESHISIRDSTYYKSPQQIFSDMAIRFGRLQKALKSSDDEIPPPEDRLTLEEIGFVEVRPGFYENVINDTEEAEVVQEVQFGDKVLFRLRTTIWEPTDFGKTSKEISYTNLPLTEAMEKIINNTEARTWGL